MPQRSARAVPALVAPPQVTYRVARSDAPLNFSEITKDDADCLNAGNTFDVLGGGVLYMASHPSGCYAETLARFRPTPAMHALLKDVRGPDGFMVVGAVPSDWRHRRLLVRVGLVSALPFVDVESPATHEFLSEELGAELVELGISDPLDISTVRGPNRLLTRAIASWAYHATDEDGAALYSGIRYISRLGHHECWAVFDGSPVQTLGTAVIEVDDADLVSVAAGWQLQVF